MKSVMAKPEDARPLARLNPFGSLVHDGMSPSEIDGFQKAQAVMKLGPVVDPQWRGDLAHCGAYSERVAQLAVVSLNRSWLVIRLFAGRGQSRCHFIFLTGIHWKDEGSVRLNLISESVASRRWDIILLKTLAYPSKVSVLWKFHLTRLIGMM